MRNKNLFALFPVSFFVLSLLIPFPITVQSAVNLPELPSLPPIGKVTVGAPAGTGFAGRSGQVNRMAGVDYLTIFIEDDKGNPYPENASTADGTITVPVTIEFTIRRGDGVLCFPSVSGIGCALGGNNLSQGQTNFGVDYIPGNGKSCRWDNGCIFELERSDLVKGAPIPGPVTLERVVATAWVFLSNSQQKISSPAFNPNLKLFTIAEPLQIDSANKTAAHVGETITLTGKNFDAAGASSWLWANRLAFDLNRQTLQAARIINSFSGTENFVHYCGPTKLKFEIPAGLSLGRHTVTLFNEWGYSNSVNIDVVSGQGTAENDLACAGSGGTITSLTPASGPVGTRVVIKGTGFGSATSGATANVVKFNNVMATISGTTADGKELTVLVPLGATTGKVTVTPAGKFEILGPVFTVTPGNPPRIDSLSPSSGRVGSEVTISGSGFGSSPAANTAKFNKVSATVLSVNAQGTELRVRVPSGASTGTVTVEPTGKAVIAGPVFTITSVELSNLSIDSLSPNVLFIGARNTVLLTGRGFLSSSLLATDNPLITLSNLSVSDDQKFLRANLSVSNASPGQVKISVTVGSAQESVNATLAAKDPQAPEISALTINPTEVEGGVKMVMAGKNFSTAATVKILGLPRLEVGSLKVDSNTQITVDVKLIPIDPFSWWFISQASAAVLGGNPGLVEVSTPKGLATFAVNQRTFDEVAGKPIEHSPGPTPAPALPDTGFDKICSRQNGLAACVQQLYVLSLGLGSLIALLMIVLSGYRYMTAAGDATQVEKAKEAFASAFIGLIIIFVAFILLYLINPDLVRFKKLELPEIKIPAQRNTVR